MTGHLLKNPGALHFCQLATFEDCLARLSCRPPLLPLAHPGPPPAVFVPLQDPDALQFRQLPTFEDCFPGSEKHYRTVQLEGTVLQVGAAAGWCRRALCCRWAMHAMP